MRKLVVMLALAALALPRAAAMMDEELTETEFSTDTVKADENQDAEEAQAYLQESDEDLAGFVQDYVKKDTLLKGAFLLEDTVSGKVLKLSLEAVSKKSDAGPNNSKTMEAVFKDPAGKKHTVLFHIQSAGFGGIDIFKIALKKEGKTEIQDKSKK